MKNLAFPFVGILLTAFHAAGCTTASCTDELRAYTFSLDRAATGVALRPSELSVEISVSTGCSTLAVQNDGTFASPSQDGLESVGGTLTQAPAGGLRVAVKLSVYEQSPSARIPVAVRLKDVGTQTVFEAKSTIEFANDECHPAPKALSL